MKKIMIPLMAALISCGSALAAPQFRGLNNKHGKTTVKVEIPASESDTSNGISVDNIRLYNNGEMLTAKKVDAIWGENSIIILEFKKLKEFDDCTLFFTVNGEPVSIDIQSFMNR